nr:hypothetical protein [Tanacetum cinerariifolium]
MTFMVKASEIQRQRQDVADLKWIKNHLRGDDVRSIKRHNDSNDDEVLNELIEYENVGMLRREKEINSFDRDDLAFQCMIGFRKSVAYFDPLLPMNIIMRKAYNTMMVERLESTGKNFFVIVRNVYVEVLKNKPYSSSHSNFSKGKCHLILEGGARNADLAKERELLASLIEKLKCEIDESKNHNTLLETSNKVLVEKLKSEIAESKNKNKSLKEANNKLSEENDLLYAEFKSSINAGLDLFLKCLNEEMVIDLRYFNSLKLEVDSLTSQLETQRTQFANEIDRLSREYYYADHMNAILGMYTELDEVTNLQCDYLELLEKCKGLETELSKSKMMSKSFESVQKHAINLELKLQQCKEKIKNDMSLKVNKSKDFCKERE